MVGWTVAAVALVGYLLGSIPTAVLVAKAKGIDPRTAGDRNPGYWNVKELLGGRAAIPVFVGDTVKGVAAGLAGTAAGHVAGLDAQGVLLATWAGVAAAMVGHAWPVFARFRGGRSILTFCGGLAVLSPRVVGICVVLLLATYAVSRSFSIAARVGVFASPFASLLVDWIWRTAAVGVLMTLIGLRFGQAALAERRRRPDSSPTVGS